MALAVAVRLVQIVLFFLFFLACCGLVVFISLRLADWILEMDFALYFVSGVVSAVGIYIYIYIYIYI